MKSVAHGGGLEIHTVTRALCVARCGGSLLVETWLAGWLVAVLRRADRKHGDRRAGRLAGDQRRHGFDTVGDIVCARQWHRWDWG